jgi:hypothetical protein
MVQEFLTVAGKFVRDNFLTVVFSKKHPSKIRFLDFFERMTKNLFSAGVAVQRALHWVSATELAEIRRTFSEQLSIGLS